MAFPTKSLALVAASSQYATALDNASLSITGDICVEGWVKFATTPSSGSAMVIMAKWLTTGSQRSYLFALDFNNFGGANLSLYFGASKDGTNAAKTDGHVDWTPSTGVWYHVAASYASTGSGTITFFINGVAQTTTYDTHTGGVILDSTALFDLGGYVPVATPLSFMDGNIGLSRVWSAQRTSGNLTSNWCTELGATANLQAEWTLDNVYTDNSGNSNTLTPLGSPSFATDVTATCGAVATTNFLTLMGVGT